MVNFTDVLVEDAAKEHAKGADGIRQNVACLSYYFSLMIEAHSS
jgi:hypothetical protein